MRIPGDIGGDFNLVILVSFSLQISLFTLYILVNGFWINSSNHIEEISLNST